MGTQECKMRKEGKLIQGWAWPSFKALRNESEGCLPVGMKGGPTGTNHHPSRLHMCVLSGFPLILLSVSSQKASTGSERHALQPQTWLCQVASAQSWSKPVQNGLVCV